MFRRLLVPLDGSPFGAAALPTALVVAERCDAALVLLTVTPPAQAGSIDLLPESARRLEELTAAAHEEATAYLDRLTADLRAQGVRAEARVVAAADVAAAIVETAVADGCDTVVMSTHGRRGLSRLVFGSVAERVVRQSRVPVLLVRPDAAALAEESADV